MGFRLNVQSVKLEHFYNILGSQDEKLVEQAFDWLKKNKLTYNKGQHSELDKHLPEICLRHLQQIVFERKIVNGLFPWRDYLWLSNLDKELQATKDFTDWIWLMYSLESLFALDESFVEVSFFNQWRYIEAFQTLKTSELLNASQERLFNYLIKGRSLDSDPMKNPTYAEDSEPEGQHINQVPYYGYLTNNELASLIDGINNFYLKVRLLPEKSVPPNWEAVMLNSFGTIYDDFVNILNSKSDLFFWAN